MTHTDSANSPLDGYEEFDINVVPTIRDVDNSLFYDEEITTDGQEPQYSDDSVESDDVEPQGELCTLEDCVMLSQVAWNIPSIVLGEHVARTEEQTAPFANALYNYCRIKGIDVNEYFGPEYMLIAAGGGLTMGIYRDHKAFKKGKKEKPTEYTDAPIVPGSNDHIGTQLNVKTGLGVTSSGETKELSPLEDKGYSTPSSSSGGDMILIPTEE
ncbi:hypothetical protein KAU11_07900 [Candidatus Babeliales bacterium]|nr:hypothetical protein [Candidatus Babeliales bacterium]